MADMTKEAKDTAKRIYERAKSQGRLLENLSKNELRSLSLDEPGIRVTNRGSLLTLSEPKSRSAMHTTNNIDSQYGEKELELLKQAEFYMSKEKLISLDVVVGDGSEGITARLMIPERFAHLAYGGIKLFKPAETPVADPTYRIIMFFDDNFGKNKDIKHMEDKKISIRNFHSPEGSLTKVVNNCDYFGEFKKGVFTGEDWRVKQKGDAIFLHAGCRTDLLQLAHMHKNKRYESISSLVIALSANGKTTLTCGLFAYKSGEMSSLVQDDGGTLNRDGSFWGFEAGAIFAKTEGLNPKDQREIYYGALRSDTLLENVHIDKNGQIDFSNDELTTNGRAIIGREYITHSSIDINAEKIDNIFIITRGDIIPAVAKLTHEQAAAFMVLGQSMESSAGDASQAGKIKNEFFCDPFIAGDRAKHANLFYDILKSNPCINCYLLNTGGIGLGTSYEDITLSDTIGILESILRRGLEGKEDWVESPTGLLVPGAIRTVDSALFEPEKRYSSSEFIDRQNALNKHRAETLEKYPGLDNSIAAVFKDYKR